MRIWRGYSHRSLRGALQITPELKRDAGQQILDRFHVNPVSHTALVVIDLLNLTTWKHMLDSFHNKPCYVQPY